MRIGVKTRRISIIEEGNYDDSGREDEEEEEVGKYFMTLRKRN